MSNPEPDLGAENARLAALVRHSHDAMVASSVDGVIEAWNPAAERIFGWSAAEAVGRHISFYAPPERADEQRALVLRVCAGETVGVETQRLTKGGERIDVLLRIVPMRNGAGHVTGHAGSLQDISAAKRAEAALRDADRRKDEFLAILAHELRNPLAPISSSVQLLRRTTRGQAAAAAPLAIMERQVAHMVRLIDDLLDLSRIGSGKLELKPERLDLAQVVAQAVETSRPLIDAARHALTLALPGAPLHVEGDATRLAQVLANLLNNAARYTPSGGHIALSVERDGDAARIAVEDDGIGIPAERLPLVFDMFAQLDRSLERAQSGLGIGLAIALRLVRMHGGSLGGSSPGAGQGSRFVVRLPLVAASAAAPPDEATAAPPPRPSGARRVLVADDNADSADSLAELLRMLGHDARAAHDGSQALALAEDFRPEVALLDIGMPRVNGYDAARRLRARPWAGALVLVAITGWGQAEDRRRSLEAGFDAHLVKPVDLGALEQLLARAR